MAELAQKLQQLQSLPEDLHLFCPRTGPDDNSCYFDEDLYGRLDNEDAVTRNKRLNAVKDAEQRKKLVLECMQILAYDGSDAAKFKEWLTARLDAQMACCDVCIRIYHRARAELKADLEADYGEDVVADFLGVIDGLSIERIKKGLVQARKDLLAAPPDQRSHGTLQITGLFALFEALSCEAFLRREDLLSEYFDEPFRLVQTKTRLRLKTFTPAMTAFLFSKNEVRWRWGFMTWTKFKRSPTGQEFDSDIKGPLSDAMRRVHMGNLEVDFLPTFWSGAKVIVSKLDKEVITHNLRALDMDICTLALDQLQLDSECFVDILGTIQILLETSPTDFWEAMGTISPKTVIEQVFNSPSLKKLLLSVVRPFCFKMGLEVLLHSLSKLNEGESVSTFVGAATVSDVLDVVAHHVGSLITVIKDSTKLQQPDDSGTIALDVIQQALKLDCLSVVIDREMLVQNRPLQHDQGIQCGPLWKAVVQGINPDTVPLAIRALAGARLLIGLEKFVTKASVPLPKEMMKFNEIFDQLSRHVSDIIERLNDLPPSTLKEILENTVNANTVITTLFSSDMDTRRATVELLKVVSSEDGRKEAVGYIVTSYFRNTLTAISMSMRRIAQRRVFAPASSTLKLSTDVMDVLCNSQDGLLRSKTLDGVEARAAEHFWQSLWQELTVIFEMTESWSDQGHDKTQMMEFCRDTMQFAERLFDECSIFASALNTASSDSEQSRDKTSIARALLEHPARTMSAAVKWLRLRDEFLSSKSVSLISKLLIRLHNVSIEIPEESLAFIEGILTGKIRAKLSGQQTAELEQALERHVGHSVTAAKREAEAAAKRQKQGTISAFFKPGAATAESRKVTSEDSDVTDSDQLSKIVKDSSRTAEAYKARILANKVKREAEAAAAKKAALAQKNTLDVAEFKRRREAEIAAKKKRDAAMLALATGRTGQTAEAGSGLAGLGIRGKDHAARGTGMMVSSDEESDDDDELDEELLDRRRL
ncbi:DEAD-box type RNA helicase [Coniosporium tulheliwenetii]|uniref:DEAD-box type RNA helicase n=1 Tax=Coniosporium tulheliwenetii TaxID=3383036 RepID=A0ACC2YK07_9PEZI|nr:DEAD-box type RNA helicase [Cladosporium sp. JES 115]